MLKLYTIILGEDYNLLISSSPESRKKVRMMGSLLFIPVFIWFVVLYAFAHEFFKLTPQGSLMVATAGALIIFLIERSIVMSKGNSYIKWFRVLIGLVMAVLSSIMLDEFIFRKDIQNQKLEDLELSYNEQSPRETQLVSETQSLSQSYHLKKEQAAAEAQGKGSGYRGVGDITKMLQDDATQILTLKNLKEQELTELHTQKSTEYEARRNDILSGATDAELLNNIKALFAFLKESKFALAVFIMFFVLMASLEFMVILFKLCSSKTSYEERLELIDKIQRQKMIKIGDRVSNNYNPITATKEYRHSEDILKRNMKGIFNHAPSNN